VTSSNNSEAAIDASFGLWLNALFNNIVHMNRGLSFDAQKAMFFETVESLLNQGRIKFQDPEGDPNRNDTQWVVAPSVIISYLRSMWPAAATDASDSELNDYFYSIPAVLWVGEDGKIYSS
jgi:hypothetical protein